MPPEPAETSFYLHKEFEISKSAWYGFAWPKRSVSFLLWPTCRIFFRAGAVGLQAIDAFFRF